MCKIRYPIFGEKRKERVEKMAQEEKQMEKMKQEIKKIFEKEGEMGYITLNLVETKEKLCKPKRKSEEEKEALSKAYQQILEEEKTTRKQTCGLFQNTEEGRRENEKYSPLDPCYHRGGSSSRRDRLWCVPLLHAGLSGRF